MREIKFRVWDKDEKLMKEIDGIYFPLGKPSSKDVTAYNGEAECYEWIYDYELMQSTGLKDINGIEIYEGDIVEVTRKHWNNCNKEYLEKTTKELGIIEFFKNLQMSLKVKEEGYYLYKPLLWALEDDSEIKIIGNIYENSELLNDEIIKK